MKNFTRSLILGCSVLTLAACGPDEIASPGNDGGDIIINPPGNGGGDGGDGGDNGDGSVEPAAGCPTVGTDALQDNGTITGPTGTWRVCGLPQVFTDDARLTQVSGVLYSLPGRVDVGVDDGPLADDSDGVVGTNVELTIDPGVTIFAATGRAWLAVNRGSTINAVGSQTQPIVFTSRDNVLGLTSNTSSGQWGGVVLMGRAPVSDCDTGTPNNNKAQCEQGVEGATSPAQFGGPDAGDSSGVMDYVQIRYSGFVLSQDSELQSLTPGGIGSGTQISNVMSYNSSDDGVEPFGGVVNMRNFIVVGAEDDSFDMDTGAKVSLQNAIAVQRSGIGDNLFEIDSPDSDYDFTALPRTSVAVSNFTGVLQSPSASQALRIRGRADFQMTNSVIIAPDVNCLRIDEEDEAAAGSRDDELGPVSFDSVLLQCNVAADSQAEEFFAAGSDNVVGFTPSLTNLVVNGTTENGATVYDVSGLTAGPTAPSSFFTDVGFVGAVTADDNWTEGWTCNSQTISFGTNVGSCSSIPVYE